MGHDYNKTSLKENLSEILKKFDNMPEALKKKRSDFTETLQLFFKNVKSINIPSGFFFSRVNLKLKFLR